VALVACRCGCAIGAMTDERACPRQCDTAHRETARNDLGKPAPRKWKFFVEKVLHKSRQFVQL